MPRTSDYAKSFVKDWERLARTGRFDLRRAVEVMLLLIENRAPLGPEWLDHPLKGRWRGRRECHIGGDFLLVYEVDDQASPSSIVFERLGTHAELFNE